MAAASDAEELKKQKLAMMDMLNNILHQCINHGIIEWNKRFNVLDGKLKLKVVTSLDDGIFTCTAIVCPKLMDHNSIARCILKNLQALVQDAKAEEPKM